MTASILPIQSRNLAAGIHNWGSSVKARKYSFFVPISNFTEYFLTAVIGRINKSHVTFSENAPNDNLAKIAPVLSSTMRDYLMGKSPLRLIAKFETVEFTPYAHVPEYKLRYRNETLECGHIVVSYSSLPAKRRRCAECMRIRSLALPPKKSSVSVGRQLSKKEYA